MKTAARPSGDTLEFSGARLAGVSAAAAQVYCSRLHVQSLFCTDTVIVRLSFVSSNEKNGSRFASTRPPDADAKAAARRVWSNAGVRVPRAGSTMKKALPFAVVVRYQKRPSAIHVGRPANPLISGATPAGSARSARA